MQLFRGQDKQFQRTALSVGVGVVCLALASAAVFRIATDNPYKAEAKIRIEGGKAECLVTLSRTASGKKSVVGPAKISMDTVNHLGGYFPIFDSNFAAVREACLEAYDRNETETQRTWIYNSDEAGAFLKNILRIDAKYNQ